MGLQLWLPVTEGLMRIGPLFLGGTASEKRTAVAGKLDGDLVDKEPFPRLPITVDQRSWLFPTLLVEDKARFHSPDHGRPLMADSQLVILFRFG